MLIKTLIVTTALLVTAATGYQCRAETAHKPKAFVNVSGEPVKNLPYANGRSFTSLDDYLAYRKSLGALDRPYYELISPDSYRLVTRLRPPGQPPEVFTRQQLLDLFGFNRPEADSSADPQ